MGKIFSATVIDQIQESCRLLDAVHVIVVYPLLPAKASLKSLISEE